MRLEEAEIRGELEKPKIFFILPKRRRVVPFAATLEPLGEDRLESSRLPDLQSQAPGVRSRTAARADTGRGCRRALYQTYFLLVSYIRDHGYPPATLLDLLAYTNRIPRDPRNGEPLRYETDGSRFSLGCAG